MKNSLFVASLLFSALQVGAQGSWEQKNSVSPTCYTQSNAFCVINDKLYVGMGTSYCFDWQEYDPVTDAYIAKATFPDTAEGGPVTFSIGGYGYVLSNRNFLWKYNPATDLWQNCESNFPGEKRGQPYFFVIGTKGYLAGGQSLINADVFKDLWEYNSITNIWTQLMDMPIGNVVGEAFAVNGKGYLTGGSVNNVSTSSYYSNQVFEYNPDLNSWTEKNHSPDQRFASSSFVIGNYAYVGMGLVNDGNGEINASSVVHKYDPAFDTWELVTSIPSDQILDEGIGFTINNKGYMGFGDVKANVVYYGENTPGFQRYLFEYTPALAGINEVLFSEHTCYPNPTSGDFVIENSSDLKLIEMTNVFGEKMEYNFSLENDRINVDLSECSAGVYFVKLSKGEKSFVIKAIKE